LLLAGFAIPVQQCHTNFLQPDDLQDAANLGTGSSIRIIGRAAAPVIVPTHDRMPPVGRAIHEVVGTGTNEVLTHHAKTNSPHHSTAALLCWACLHPCGRQRRWRPTRSLCRTSFDPSGLANRPNRQISGRDSWLEPWQQIAQPTVKLVWDSPLKSRTFRRPCVCRFTDLRFGYLPTTWHENQTALSIAINRWPTNVRRSTFDRERLTPSEAATDAKRGEPNHHAEDQYTKPFCTSRCRAYKAEVFVRDSPNHLATTLSPLFKRVGSK